MRLNGKTLLFLLLAVLATGFLAVSLALASPEESEFKTARVEVRGASETTYEFSCEAQAQLCSDLADILDSTFPTPETSSSCDETSVIRVDLVRADGSEASETVEEICGGGGKYGELSSTLAASGFSS